MSPRLIFLPRDGSPLTVDPEADGPSILVVPGEDVLVRWLALPARRDAQAASAAAFMLEEELAAPRDRLHVALGASEADGLRLVVVVDRERMQSWLGAAAAAGLAPDLVIPDCLLLPEPEDETAIAAAVAGAVAVRARRLALTCEPDLLPLVMAERAYLSVDNADARSLFAAGAAAPMINLRQGAYAPVRGSSGGRVLAPALLAAVLALLVLAVPAIRGVRYELAARKADQAVEALGGQAALRDRLMRIQARERFAGSAAAVFAAVERVEGMELQSLLYGEDGAFRISALHTNYSDVELLRTGLARAGFAVQETNTTPEDGRVLSDLILRRVP